MTAPNTIEDRAKIAFGKAGIAYPGQQSPPPPPQGDSDGDEEFRRSVDRLVSANVPEDVIAKFIQENGPGGADFGDVEGGSSSFEPWGSSGGSSGSWGKAPWAPRIATGDSPADKVRRQFGLAAKPDAESLSDIREGLGQHSRSALQGIPGAGAAIAGAESVVRGEPYTQARNRLKNETADIPAWLRIPEQMLVGGRALPTGGNQNARSAWEAVKQGGKQGAAMGAADAALSGEPESLGERARNTVIGGTLGAGLGAGLSGVGHGVARGRDLLGLNKRVKDAGTPGQVWHGEMKPEIEASTAKNYGVARAEAKAGGGTSPGIQNVLKRKTIGKEARQVRADNEGVKMSDAEVAMAVDQRFTARIRDKHKALVLKPGDDETMAAINRLRREQKQLRKAMTSESEKPALWWDVEPPAASVEPEVAELGHYRPKRGEMEPIFETRQGAPMGGTAGTARFRPGSLPGVEPSGRVRPVAATDVQGPAPPGAQLRAKAEKITPGVEVGQPETVWFPKQSREVSLGSPRYHDPPPPKSFGSSSPDEWERPFGGMRIQTAPAEKVPALMPGYTKALSERARLGGEARAFQNTVDATKREFGAAIPKGSKIDTHTTEAFEKDIDAMTLGQAKRALQAMLGTAKQQIAKQPGASAVATGAMSAGGAMVGGLPGAIASATGLRMMQRLVRRIQTLQKIEPLVGRLDWRTGGSQTPTPNTMLEMLGKLNAPFAAED